MIQRHFYCLVTEHRYRNTRSILLFRHRITSPCYNVNFIITSQTVDALYCCNVNSIVHTGCALQQRQLYCFVIEGRHRATTSNIVYILYAPCYNVNYIVSSQKGVAVLQRQRQLYGNARHRLQTPCCSVNYTVSSQKSVAVRQFCLFRHILQEPC